MAYQKFVADGLGGTSPLSKVVGQIYLGSEIFRAQIEENMQSKIIDDEIPAIQRHPVRPKIEEVLANTAKHYQIKVSDLISSCKSTEARAVAIYLYRHLGGHDLKIVAEQFSISYTHVSKVAGKVRGRTNSDSKFRNRVPFNG